MASNYLIFLVTICLIEGSIENTIDNKVEDDSSPITEAISSILKEQSAENIGAMVQSFLQEQGGNIIGDALANLGKQNAGQLLQGLGSVLANQGGDGNKEKGNCLKFSFW